ncbi:MAG: SgcJ/EcaC family oxidoreductase [Gemmatimonadota bacterium]
MTSPIDAADRSAIDAIVANLQRAWNAGDGDAFAVPFAEDADFVNVRADHHRGRGAIAGGHNGIFRSIYAGSTVAYQVKSARLLAGDIALAHVQAELNVPAGPLAGKINALFSAVLRRTASGWEIVSFHNTALPAEMSR